MKHLSKNTKRIIQLVVLLFIRLHIFSQEFYIPNTQIPFHSKFIEVLDDHSGLIQITPKDTNIDFSIMQMPLNEEVFMNSFLKVLNQFRQLYGRKPLAYSPGISENLKNSLQYGQALNGITHMAYGFYTDYNYVKEYPNREYMFGEYLLDVMKISGDVFQELLSKKAQVAGYFFRQNPVDHSYDFIVFIK